MVSSKRKWHSKAVHPATSAFQVDRKDWFKWRRTGMEAEEKTELKATENNTTDRKGLSYKEH